MGLAEKLLAFAGGFAAGFAAGAVFGSYAYLTLVTESAYSPYLMVGNLLVGVAAGFLAGWEVSGRERGVKLEGRFWRFPQGPLMVQISLKRMGSLVGSARGEEE